MTDHADIVRYELRGLPDALAALDALEAEIRSLNEQVVGAVDLLEGAVAERHELKNRLAVQQNWQTLYEREKAEVARLREGFEFSCQCGKSYVFPPPSDPRNRDDNPHPDGEEPCMCGGAGCAYCEEDA